MKVIKYKKPRNIEELIECYDYQKMTVIGGGTFIKNSCKVYEEIIDLEKLKLNYIKEESDRIIIGAYTTLREIEMNKIVISNLDGILSYTCSNICGIQLRNMATIGGSLAGKFGFSDIYPVLLALDAKIRFIDNSVLLLEEYMKCKLTKKIIKEIEIGKEPIVGRFKCFKRTALDFSISNLAVVFCNSQFRIAVGARPKIASRCRSLEARLNNDIRISKDQIRDHLKVDITFGTNLKASKEYREDITVNMINESIKEVYYASKLSD